MESLIYYPTFEPPSNIWLKFSLLYFENFMPIVPSQRIHLISNEFRQIEKETDLVTLYSPSFNDGYNASLRAIEEAEILINSSYDRSMLYRQSNVLRKWRNPDNWNFLIFREKFSDNWIYFCKQHNIGRQTNEGVLLPEELAFLYMTYLAKEIAFKKNAAIITDNNRLDNFTNYYRATTPTIERRTKFAKGLFNLLIPKNLADIPFTQLIEFRNKNRDLITSFNQELENVQNNIGNGITHKDFINRYNNIYSEISNEILIQGIGIASIPLAAYILIQNPIATTPEYVKEILGGLGVILGGGYALNKGLQDSRTKRYCKKYLTNLKKLG